METNAKETAIAIAYAGAFVGLVGGGVALFNLRPAHRASRGLAAGVASRNACSAEFSHTTGEDPVGGHRAGLCHTWQRGPISRPCKPLDPSTVDSVFPQRSSPTLFSSITDFPSVCETSRTYLRSVGSL